MAWLGGQRAGSITTDSPVHTAHAGRSRQVVGMTLLITTTCRNRHALPDPSCHPNYRVKSAAARGRGRGGQSRGGTRQIVLYTLQPSLRHLSMHSYHTCSSQRYLIELDTASSVGGFTADPRNSEGSPLSSSKICRTMSSKLTRSISGSWEERGGYGPGEE